MSFILSQIHKLINFLDAHNYEQNLPLTLFYPSLNTVHPSFFIWINSVVKMEETYKSWIDTTALKRN